MTTQELRTYIDRVLGNGIRCLLPSYWWKRLFNLTIDKVDGIEEKVTDAVNRLDVLENDAKFIYAPTDIIGSAASELTDGQLAHNAEMYAYLKKQVVAETYVVYPDDLGIYIREEVWVSPSKIPEVVHYPTSLSYNRTSKSDGSGYDFTFVLETDTKIYVLFEDGYVGVEEKEGSSGSVYFIPNPVGSYDEEIKAHNKESFEKVRTAFNQHEVLDVKVFDGEEMSNVINLFSGETTLRMAYHGGDGYEKFMMVYSDGATTIEDTYSSADMSTCFFFNADGQLSDSDKASNIKSHDKLRLLEGFVDTKIVYQHSSDDTSLYTVTTIIENANGSFTLIASDAKKIFTVDSSGSITETDLPSITVDSQLSNTSENPVQNKVVYKAFADLANEVAKELGEKVDKVSGKQLSTEDFTTALKTKLNGLSNYDDTAIQNAVNSLTNQINTLVSGDASTAIESFNEIIAFLNGVTDSENLDSIIASIEQQIAAKYSKPSAGIPKSDLASDVQASLGQADSAIQNVKTINGESIIGEGNIEVGVDTSTLATKEELAEAEEVTAAALNELNDRIIEATENFITKEGLESDIAKVNESIVENEEIIAAALNDLDNRKANKEYVNDLVDRKADKEYVEDALANLDIDIDTSTLVTKDEFAEVEEVWATSYNQLIQKVTDVQQYIYNEAASRRQFDEAIAEIEAIMAENESVITAAWNQLKTRIDALEAALRQGE